jgi:hypothetical protein
MIYIPCFIKIASGIQKVTWGGYIDTQRQDGDHVSLFFDRLCGLVDRVLGYRSKGTRV